ncbi:MAG: CRISPR-associated protein [Dehalococcoidia bacterium]
MRDDFVRVARSFFNSEAILPFLFGAMTLSVLGNAVFGLLTKRFGSSYYSLGAIALGTFLILLAATWVVTLALSRRRGALAAVEPRAPRTRKGLILLIGQPDPARKAIGYHSETLTHCWLICSDQTKESAQLVRSEFPSIDIPPPITVDDVHNPEVFFKAVREIYRKGQAEGLAEDEIIADYTGMTASASVGMVLACLTNRPLQYMQPASVNARLQGTKPGDPIEIALTWLPAGAETASPAVSTVDGG